MSTYSTGGVLPGVLDVIELFELFTQVADSRKTRGIRHRLATVLTVAVFAVMAGVGTYREIGDRAADLPAMLLEPAGDIDAEAAELLVCRHSPHLARDHHNFGCAKLRPRLDG